MDFDIIPYEDIVWGERLGAGSFGSVYRGTYLGIDIAIKEVLPSTEYDVHKYFEREWRIMRECRHPNIVLFLGLAKAPENDGRVFIISEFVPRGTFRQYILSTGYPFPWPLRLSFATDVARAVAYLHGRQCIHRDLKGENLLITSNERIKVTDFGFARIASRNAEEMRRMTFCGTDGYMSPEIINGQDFDLPTDVFSLGIILIEILSRKLVDSRTYVRPAPSFVPDPAEVRRRASPGCPPALLDLALSCCLESPSSRPKMPDILLKLREIELEILSRCDDKEHEHVGSIKLVHRGGKRAMPIFVDPKNTDDEEDERKMEEEALVTLAKLDIGGNGAEGDRGDTWRTARWVERPSVISEYSDASEMKGHQRLLPSQDTSSSIDTSATSSFYSTEVVRQRPVESASVFNTATPFGEESAGSTATVKGALAEAMADPVTPADPTPDTPAKTDEVFTGEATADPHQGSNEIPSIPSLASSPIATIPIVPVRAMTKYEKARAEEKAEEELSDTRASGIGTHRFTLVDNDGGALLNGKKVSNYASNFVFAFLSSSKAPSTGCAVCHKRLGQRPALQCDDCSVIVHVKCSHGAPRNCTDGGTGMGREIPGLVPGDYGEVL